MSRYRFRVWDTDLRKYVSGAEFGLARMSLKPDEDGGQVFSFDSLYPGRFVFEQSTGLKDRNGREIYMGDIVKVTDYGLFEVFWRSWDSSASLGLITPIPEEYVVIALYKEEVGDYEVVGNIHEPNLLYAGRSHEEATTEGANDGE